MKTIHEMLKKYRHVKMDMTTYFIASEYYEKNIGIETLFDNVHQFVSHMVESEVLAIVIWFYNGRDIPVLQFMVLNTENKYSESMFEFRISYHLESDKFYDSECEFRTYQVRQRWAKFAKNILGFEPFIKQ